MRLRGLGRGLDQRAAEVLGAIMPKRSPITTTLGQQPLLGWPRRGVDPLHIPPGHHPVVTFPRPPAPQHTSRRAGSSVRPSPTLFSGQLVASSDGQRMNAVLRFLFAAVIIDEHRGQRGTFDYSRIDIEPNPL